MSPGHLPAHRWRHSVPGLPNTSLCELGCHSVPVLQRRLCVQSDPGEMCPLLPRLRVQRGELHRVLHHLQRVPWPQQWLLQSLVWCHHLHGVRQRVPARRKAAGLQALRRGHGLGPIRASRHVQAVLQGHVVGWKHSTVSALPPWQICAWVGHHRVCRVPAWNLWQQQRGERLHSVREGHLQQHLQVPKMPGL